MSNILSICAVIRVDLINSKGMEKDIAIASRVLLLISLHSPRKPFNFAINAGFLIKLIEKVILLNTLVAMFHFGAVSQIFKNYVLIANINAL